LVSISPLPQITAQVRAVAKQLLPPGCILKISILTTLESAPD
jgi:hypothetical protein